MVPALKIDLKGFAEDSQGVVIGVEGAVDDRGDHAFGIVVQECFFEDAFAGAGLSEHQAEAALLGVNAEDVEDFLLVSQQGDGFSVERITLETGRSSLLTVPTWLTQRASTPCDSERRDVRCGAGSARATIAGRKCFI